MLDERFWMKVNRQTATDCWEWTATRNNKGYGLFSWHGEKRLAHRLAFTDTNGPIPKGALVLHHCDNPRCVNSDHLYLGDWKANVADMDERGRRVSNSPKGADNHNAKLTDEAVLSMRRDYLSGIAIDSICARYGITRNTMHDYTSGRAWKHLLEPGDLALLKAEGARRIRSSAKLDRETVLAIRRRLAAGEQGKDLAAEYGVHKATISEIKLRKIWAEI